MSVVFKNVISISIHIILTLIKSVISLCLCLKGSGKSWYTLAGLSLLCHTNIVPSYR